MLREFINNMPVSLQLSAEEFRNLLAAEFAELIREKCGVKLQDSASMTSNEMERVAGEVKNIYDKILGSAILIPQQKNVVASSIIIMFLDLWRRSGNPELFFIKIRQTFAPEQIVTFIALYINDIRNFRWVMNFFATHRELFPRQNKKIRTIGVYYPRYFSGGIERVISLTIPMYLQLGYRVVFFTDFYKPEVEYPLPPPILVYLNESFSRIHGTRQWLG